MSYDFSFSKKSIILMIIGCVAIGVLLFFAGFIIGLDKGQNQSVVQASLPGQKQSESKTGPEKAETGASSEKPSASKKEESSASASEKPGGEKGQETAASPTAEKKTPEAAQEDKDKDDAKGKDGKEKDKPAFSVQLGAFQAEDHALALRDKFKAKGYPVFLFHVLDSNGHLWHTVRTGHYADMKEASHAAEKITDKEQISAWVRPANAF